MLPNIASHLLCGMLASACIVVLAKRLIEDYRDFHAERGFSEADRHAPSSLSSSPQPAFERR